MTVTFWELFTYAGALLILFLTPGPVWVALLARALSGGFRGAWPLAVGVSLGDILWPLLAILGVTWIAAVFDDFLFYTKALAAITFIVMGLLIIRSAGKPIRTDGRLTRPGLLPGFLAGVTVIIANPKAVLFYMGILPEFFDVTKVTATDIALICGLSAAIPMVGNLMLAGFVGHLRGFLSSQTAMRRANIVAGCLLIGVGVLIPYV